MKKKQIDFQVQMALERFKKTSQELGLEIDRETLAEYRQILEGFALREMAQIEETRKTQVAYYSC